MPAGLEIRNDAGFFQITDQYKNFVLVSKGTVALDGTEWNLGSSHQYGAHAVISFPNTLGYPPLLALRCSVYVAIFRVQLVGGNWVYDITSQLGGLSTAVIEWFAFAPTPNVIPANYGLEVYTAGGQLAYHSGYLPMNVQSYQQQALGHSGNFSLPSGRKIALVILGTNWGWSPQVPAGTWQQFLTGTAVRTTATNVGNLIGNLQYGQKFAPLNFGWPGGSSGSWVGMALDVTNY